VGLSKVLAGVGVARDYFDCFHDPVGVQMALQGVQMARGGVCFPEAQSEYHLGQGDHLVGFKSSSPGGGDSGGQITRQAFEGFGEV
jgi:hypothetical protein